LNLEDKIRKIKSKEQISTNDRKINDRNDTVQPVLFLVFVFCHLFWILVFGFLISYGADKINLIIPYYS
jgi:hypothetical protein